RRPWPKITADPEHPRPEAALRHGSRVASRDDGIFMTAASVLTDSEWAVQTRGLTKRFGDTIAVDHVDLRIPRGCAFGYLGPNGAGKTTLIRVLLGLTHADAGE